MTGTWADQILPTDLASYSWLCGLRERICKLVAVHASCLVVPELLLTPSALVLQTESGA